MGEGGDSRVAGWGSVAYFREWRLSLEFGFLLAGMTGLRNGSGVQILFLSSIAGERNPIMHVCIAV